MEGRFSSPPRSSNARQAWIAEGGRWADGLDGSSVPTSARTEDTEGPTLRSYHRYPEEQPFIRDSYRRPQNKPVRAFPESNRQAVMSALQSLQTKIRQLERERGQAEQNLRSLAVETDRYHDILHPGQSDNRDYDSTGNSNLSRQSQEVEGQLAAAETRSQLLERQLDYMRQMLRNSEQSKAHAVQRSVASEHARADREQRDLKIQIDKINELERDHLRLTATQTMAENKIRELENKLREERHVRKVLQERSAGLESQAEAGRLLLSTENNRPVKRVVKKKKSAGRRSKSAKKSTRTEPREHYRLNLAEIPFVAGQSTSESHSVPANVQKVLSMMKSHNTKLCSSPGCTVGRTHSSGSSSGVSSAGSDLSELLLQLRDEFGHLSLEHAELSRQLQDTRTEQLRDDLERELDHLVTRMELKGDQINKVRRHQLTAKKKKKGTTLSSQRRPMSARACVPTNGVVEVKTTIKSKSDGHHYVQPGSTFQAKNFLKDLKKIQTTLGKDDLSWDC